MKKILVSGLVVSSIVAVSLFAKCDMKKENTHKKDSCHMSHVKHNKKSKFIYLVAQLDLTDIQEAKITKVIDEYKNKPKANPYDAFSKDSFDKKKYLDTISNMKSNRLKDKADMMEKVYKILTKTQKVKLKKLLDEQKGKSCAKHCNGGR
jgi:protein CpxP